MNSKYYYLTFGLAICSAVGFYFLQNQILISTGGSIALAKSTWLCLAMLYWYFLPVLIVLDKSTPPLLKKAYILLLVSMLARAVLELYMMYVSRNWHHYIGIVHDVFSIVMLVYFLIYLQKKQFDTHILFKNLIIITWMFVIEICFVFYMVNFVTIAGEQIFFVPVNQGHQFILFATWCANVLLILWQCKFISQICYQRRINDVE